MPLPLFVRFFPIFLFLLDLAHSREIAQTEVEQGLNRAIRFFHEKVSVSGGYLWRYSPDLKKREGEELVKAPCAWVQPPGTPTIGIAILQAYHATGNEDYLEVARESGQCLLNGQLASGGWSYKIPFQESERRAYRFRNLKSESGHRYFESILDDDTSQAALRFLMLLDEATGFKDQSYREAIDFAWNRILAGQYENGAWPQRIAGAAPKLKSRAHRARFPEKVKSRPKDHRFRHFFTFNDDVMATMVETLLLAHGLYQDDRFWQAAVATGDFILMARLPDPQPAWAQQYNWQLEPDWARPFEPPAVSGWESQNLLLTLVKLYRATGLKRFLDPVPETLSYLENSQLSDGKLARFYELKTNRPLYFDEDFALTSQRRKHSNGYGFTVRSKLAKIRAEYEKAHRKGRENFLKDPKKRIQTSRPDVLTKHIKHFLQELDERGAWVEKGKLKFDKTDPGDRVIQGKTFSDRVRLMATYLVSTK